MVSRSSASPRKFGSISGRRQRIGAAERDAAAALRPQQADVAARSRCPGGACGRGRRPSPCRNAAGCRARRDRAGFSGSRRIRRNSRSSARGVRAGTGGCARSSRGMPFKRKAVEVRIVGHVAEHEIRDGPAGSARRRADDARLAMPCLPSAAPSPTPDSISNCGVWNAPEATITSRRARICFSLLALPVFDADRALAFEQDAGGVRAGLDAQIGAAADMRMEIGARRAPAFAVLLRHLVDAEAFMLLGIEILADPELALPARPAGRSAAPDCRCAIC